MGELTSLAVAYATGTRSCSNEMLTVEGDPDTRVQTLALIAQRDAAMAAGYAAAVHALAAEWPS